MKFTKAQRRWMRLAFYDMAGYHTVKGEEESREMYRTFVNMLSRQRRATWRSTRYPQSPAAQERS